MLVWAPLLMVPFFSHAEQDNTQSILETIVVTSTKEAKLKIDTAESIDVFGEGEIDIVAPSHPSEILNRSAGVHVNNLGGEGHMTAIRQPITTRGVYLYLEDGVPVRPSGFFNHNALYEVNIPQSGMLEVTKGPGSALYGSDAIGGMINAISRKPPEQTQAMVNMEAGSFNWLRGLLSAGTSHGDHGVNLTLNTTSSAGYRDAADYDRSSLSTRWDYQPSADLSIKTLFSYTQVEQSGTSSLEEDDYKNNTKKNKSQGNTGMREVDALRLSSEFAFELDHTSLVTLTPYYRDNSMKLAPSWMVTYDPSIRESEFQSYGLLSKYRVDLSSDLQWIVGVDFDYSPSTYVENPVNHTQVGDTYTGFTIMDSKNYDFEGDQTSLAPYAQVEYQWNKQLSTTAGLRYDYFKLEYQDKLASSIAEKVFIPQLGRPATHLRPDDQVKTFKELSPKLGAVYKFDQKHATYANYRQAFTIPSVGTLFRSGSTKNTANLEPIKADSYELGIRGQATDWLNYEVALYRLDISDDIISVIDGFERNVFNAGKTRHQGIELALNGDINESLSFAFAFSKTDQEYKSFSYTCCRPSKNIDVSGNTVGKSPETIGNLTLAYSPQHLQALRIEAEWTHLGEYSTDETNTQTYPGHDLFNLRANYQISDALELYGRVQNLTDKLHSTYTANQVGSPNISYRPGNPRAYYAGVRVFF